MDATGVPGTTRKENAAKVVQACIRCRQKKNKCDGRTPSCSTCESRGEECVYGAHPRRRGPGRSKQHIRALEQRLSDLEALTRQPGGSIGKEGTIQTSSRVEAGPSGADQARHANKESLQAIPTTVDPPGSTALENDVQNLKIREEAERRFPLFKMVTDSMAGEYKSRATGRSLTSIPGDHVPVREAETWLVENTVPTLCDEYPLFDVPTLIEWVRQPATLKGRHKSADWACLNALIAIGMHIRTLNRSYKDVAPYAWAYLKNAYSALPEVMIQENELVGAQAALAMAMFLLRASGDTCTAAMMLSVAIRVIQTNSRPVDGHGLETWKRVFWVSYVLDVEMSLNCGIPPLHHDEDIDIPLPQVDALNNVAGNEVDCAPNDPAVFPFLAQLSTIQSRIRKELYAARAFSLPDDKLVEIMSDLGLALQDWRSKVPLEIQPSHRSAPSRTELEMPVVMLRLVYYNALTMVHWAVWRHSDLRLGASDREGPRQGHIADSVVKVNTGVKLTLYLLPRMKSKPLTDTWRMLPYTLASGLALFALILREPSHAEANLTRELVRSMVQFVDDLVNDEALPLQGILTGCTAIQEVITNAVCEDPRVDAETGLPTYSHPQTQAVFSHLQRMTHPMYVAQALLGNTPNRDTAVARSLSEALSIPWDAESSFSPWVPEALRPGSHGFKFNFTQRI